MSKIEWTDKTWQVSAGCDMISPGCMNCYAMKMAYRLMHIAPTKERYAGTVEKTAGGHIRWTGKINLLHDNLLTPLEHKKSAKFFVDSMGDLFHEDIPFDYIDKVFTTMALCPQHVFQVLTKRADRMKEYMQGFELERIERIAEEIIYTRMDGKAPAPWFYDTHNKDEEGMMKAGDWIYEGLNGTELLHNVHMGVSVENQTQANQRIPLLQDTPAVVKFLSIEPLIGPVDILKFPEISDNLDWVIVGGESGRDARPMHPDWARKLRVQCEAAGIPFFFKQWGEWQPGSETGFNSDHIVMLSDGQILKSTETASVWCRENNISADYWNAHNPQVMAKVGKHLSGRILDGKQYDNMPAEV